MYERLSSICSRLLMPDSTVMTPSRLAAKRMAQEALEACGFALRKIFTTGSGGVASIPPLTGSMMMTGFSCLLATS